MGREWAVVWGDPRSIQSGLDLGSEGGQGLCPVVDRDPKHGGAGRPRKGAKATEGDPEGTTEV